MIHRPNRKKQEPKLKKKQQNQEEETEGPKLRIFNENPPQIYEK